MKKIFLTIFMFLLFPLFSFANDSQYYLGEKYQGEINKFIDVEIVRYKRKIDNLYKKAKNINKDELDGKIYILVFEFYESLIHFTQKYESKEIYIPETGFDVELLEILEPYFVENNVNVRKIEQFLDYIEKRKKRAN